MQPRCRFLSLLLFTVTLPAQTVTWTAQGNLATITDWNNPANWSTGVVPAGSSYEAVLTQATPAFRNFPNGPYINTPGVPVESVTGGALPVITGSLTLGQLRFQVGATGAPFPYTSAVYIGSPSDGTPGTLVLDGNGLQGAAAGNSLLEVNVTSGSSITFKHRGSISTGGTNTLSVYLGETTGLPSDPARLTFRDDTAIATPTRLINIIGRGPAALVFMDRVTAGNGNLTLATNSTTEFHNTANAGAAQINLGTNNLLLFTGDSSAGASSIRFNGGGFNASTTIVRFAGRSSAAQATISQVAGTGAVEFVEQATGNSINLAARRLDVSGAETGTGSTGRQRASTSTPAPASVVANDARTISVGTIAVQDLLLGSNTLEVTGGIIGNIRDSGGAYLSAAGDNLVGGGLIKTGPGTLQLLSPLTNFPISPVPSPNVISGLTIVRGGTLISANRLAALNIESAGTYIAGGGLAVVDGPLLNAGTVRPAFSTGAASPLRANGNYTQAPGGTLEIYAVNEPGTYGRMSVGGTATLAGRLNLVVTNSFFQNRAPGTATLDLLQAGAVSGQFDSVSSWIRVRPTLTYRADGVSAKLELLPLAALAGTPAQQALGAYLDAVHTNHGNLFPNNYQAIEDGLNTVDSTEKFRRILDNFAPDRYGAVLDHGFATALLRRSTLDRLSNRPDPATGRGRAFVAGGRRELAYAAIDGLPAASASTTHWLAGGSWHSGRWTFGGYVASEEARLQLDGAGSSADIESVEPGVFVRLDAGANFIEAAAGFSRDSYRLHRVVDYVYFSPTVMTNTATPRGARTDLSLRGGRTWQAGGWALTPFVGAVLSRWHINDFTEGHPGSIQHDSLEVNGWSRRSLRGRAGFEAAGNLWRDRLRARVGAAWWHEFETDRSIPARFVGAPSAYLAPGRAAETDLALASLGLELRLGRAGLYAEAGGAWGRNSRVTADFSGGFQWRF